MFRNLALFLLLLIAPSAWAGNKVALVIGNADYPGNARLANPLNDAQDMARVLQALGFSVTLLPNSGLRGMSDAVNAFGKTLTSESIGFFYYAGHGMQVNGRNYLIPVDANLQSESDVEFECIDVGRVMGKMHDARSKLNIIVLDACRDNPFARGFRTKPPQGLAQMDAPPGSIIAYATAPGALAADGQGRNGLYTSHLLKHLPRPGVTIEQVLKEVGRGVHQDSGGVQMPWISTSYYGDFFPAGEPDMQQVAALIPSNHQPEPRKENLPISIATMRVGQTGWTVPTAMYADNEGKVWLKKDHEVSPSAKDKNEETLFVVRSISGYTVDVSKCTHKWTRKKVSDTDDVPVSQILNDPSLAQRGKETTKLSSSLLAMAVGQKAWVEPGAMYADKERKLWLKRAAKIFAEQSEDRTVQIERKEDGFVVDITKAGQRTWEKQDTADTDDAIVVDLVY
jgi:hypothetical protein